MIPGRAASSSPTGTSTSPSSISRTIRRPGSERGKNFSGIHHIGFQVESLEAIAEQLTAAGSRRRHDVEQALGVKPGTEGNVEVKWTGPDGVMLDVSKTGWLGTPTFGQ